MTESELRALLKKLRPLASDKMTVNAPPPKPPVSASRSC